MSNNKRVYITTMVLSAIFGILKSLLIAKNLKLEEFAIFSELILICSYLIYVIQPGIDMGYLRIGAILVGKGYHVQKNILTNQTFSFLFVLGLLITFLSALIYVLKPEAQNYYHYLGIYSFGLALFNFSSTIQRINNELIGFGSFLLLRGGITLLFVAFFSDFFGLIGIIYSEIISYFLLSFIILLRHKVTFQRPQKKIISRLIGQGIPFTANNVITGLSSNSDQWLMSQFYSKLIFGQYSFLMILFNVGKGLLNIMSQSLNPEMLHLYGRSKDIYAIIRRIESLIFKVLIVGIPIVLVSYFLSQYAILNYFQNFKIVISSIPFILIGVLFYVSNLYPVIFIALNKGKSELIFSIGTTIIFVLSSIYGIIFKQNLLFFSIAFMLIRIIIFLIYFLRVKNLALKKSVVTT